MQGFVLSTTHIGVVAVNGWRMPSAVLGQPADGHHTILKSDAETVHSVLYYFASSSQCDIILLPNNANLQFKYRVVRKDV